VTAVLQFPGHFSKGVFYSIFQMDEITYLNY